MQKSEDKMLNAFEKKFGDADQAFIVLGNWSKNEERKGNEPTINKRFRKLFRRRRYRTFLIDEFRTSKLCNGCGCELEKFLYKEKTDKKGQSVKVLCHGLLRCKSERRGCQTKHNRDKNAVKNMLKIICHLIYRNEKPERYKRGVNLNNVAGHAEWDLLQQRFDEKTVSIRN